MEVARLSTMSLEEYAERFEQGAFEFINGEIIPVMPGSAFENYDIANLLAILVNQYAYPELGKAFVETPFILPSATDRTKLEGSRIPDMMFVEAVRLNQYRHGYPEWRNNPLALVPDWVVEIISPTDPYLDVLKKVRVYLADGVKLVWLIEPSIKEITVYIPHSQQHTTYIESDTISGGNVLPDFNIAVKTLFEI